MNDKPKGIKHIWKRRILQRKCRQRIVEGLKAGKSGKIPRGSAGLELPGLAVAWCGKEEEGSPAVHPLFLNPSIHPKVRIAEVQSS